MHNALGWLSAEIRKYEHDWDEAIPLSDGTEKIIADVIDTLTEIAVDNDDESDDNDDDNEDNNDTGTTCNNIYTISTGNTGLVLVNQVMDYMNRGDQLSDMCLYEYCSKIYKTRFTEEEKKKYSNELWRIDYEEKHPDRKRKPGPKPQIKYFFTDEHPQSQTHWQKLRTDRLIPALSKLPSNPNTSKEKFHKCILLLFKPFSCFTDLFNGISWEDSYETWDFTRFSHYIDNICEMHIGIDEKEERRNNDDNDENTVDDPLDEFDEDDVPLNSNEDDMHEKTTEALDIIRNSTTWLQESISNQSVMLPVYNTENPLPPSKVWKDSILKQNLERRNNKDTTEEEDEQHIPTAEQLLRTRNNQDVTFSVEPSDEKDLDEIADDIIIEYSLNKKQEFAFKLAISNVIKRERNEETRQILAYIGGPGGTGKSQVIKAVVAFHKKIKRKHTLKLTARTGTAAKIIGGSTSTTLFSLSSYNKSKETAKKSTLEKTFSGVNTIIVDEVSMIGAYHLADMSKTLTKATGANPAYAFGNVDMIFFGDFYQFAPVKDTPLYDAWKENREPGAAKKEAILNVWKNLSHVVFLDEQMRVQDSSYLNLLNRLREGKCTQSDVEMLNKRVIGHHVDITSISNNPIIVPGNELAMEINKIFAYRHSLNKRVLVTKGKDTYNKGKPLPSDLAAMIKDMPPTSTGQLPGELPLFVGMPIYISNNVATELGLTNGTSGIVKAICLRNGETISEEDIGFHHVQFNDLDCIIVELNDVSVKPLRGLQPNQIPIFPITGKPFDIVLKHPNRKVKNKKISVKRKHFPIVPRFSVTAHKSQGLTLDKAIVDLVPNPKYRGTQQEVSFAYVPLSRVRRLEDLTILREFPASVILKPRENKGRQAMMNDFKERDLCKGM